MLISSFIHHKRFFIFGKEAHLPCVHDKPCFNSALCHFRWEVCAVKIINELIAAENYPFLDFADSFIVSFLSPGSKMIQLLKQTINGVVTSQMYPVTSWTKTLHHDTLSIFYLSTKQN